MLGVVAAWLLARLGKADVGDTRIVGDSLALGVGSAYAHLDKGSNTQAVSGTTTLYWLDDGRWEKAIKGAKLVFASLGTNDLHNGRSPAQLQASVLKLNAQADAMGVPVVWILPNTPLWNTKRGTTAFGGVSVLPLRCAAAPDGKHLTAAGYACAAEAVQERARPS